MTRKLIIRVLLCSTFIAGTGAILQSCIFDPGARTLFASEEPARNATPASKPTSTVRRVSATSNQPAFTRSENSSGGNSGSGGGSSSSGGGWSDRRLKTDIRRLGTSALGVPVYAFRYIWGGPLFVGTMAQDLLAIRPEAVIATGSGYYMVDYDRLDIAMISLPEDAPRLTDEATMALAAQAARIRSQVSVRQPFVQAAM
ncbi:hypothetical protein M2311_005543 [Rhizobium leguminosarum]|nr:hypothetical protein [Rhizobium leguminosarum]